MGFIFIGYFRLQGDIAQKTWTNARTTRASTVLPVIMRIQAIPVSVLMGGKARTANITRMTVHLFFVGKCQSSSQASSCLMLLVWVSSASYVYI